MASKMPGAPASPNPHGLTRLARVTREEPTVELVRVLPLSHKDSMSISLPLKRRTSVGRKIQGGRRCKISGLTQFSGWKRRSLISLNQAGSRERCRQNEERAMISNWQNKPKPGSFPEDCRYSRRSPMPESQYQQLR